MAYFLGVDAGGTNTFAVIVNELGEVIGIGTGGNGNHQINLYIAEKSLHDAVNGAITNAKISRDELTFSYFGIAGADRPVDFQILTPIIDKLNLPNYEIACDTYIALRAGTDRSYGVVIICGTGVNCAGISTEQAMYQCGGFNYLHGDFGGGTGLANEVYRSVIRAWDGRGEQTVLTELLLEFLNYQTVDEMFHDYLDHKKSVPADVVKLLFIAAKAADKVAVDLLKLQGKELGLSARAVIKRLNLETETFDIVMGGSVLTRSGDELIERAINEITLPVAPRSRTVKLNTEPVVGALLLAMERANYPITEEVTRHLHGITEIKVG